MHLFNPRMQIAAIMNMLKNMNDILSCLIKKKKGTTFTTIRKWIDGFR